jgi:hypothetical protein
MDEYFKHDDTPGWGVDPPTGPPPAGVPIQVDLYFEGAMMTNTVNCPDAPPGPHGPVREWDIHAQGSRPTSR